MVMLQHVQMVSNVKTAVLFSWFTVLHQLARKHGRESDTDFFVDPLLILVFIDSETVRSLASIANSWIEDYQQVLTCSFCQMM